MNQQATDRIKILVLGISGMLGHKVFEVLTSYPQYVVFGTVRNKTKIIDIFGDNDHIIEADASLESNTILETITNIKPNVVINCIGITKQKKEDNDLSIMIYLNSIFPHQLANICSQNNSKLITISTDCVFNGQKGEAYTQNDLPTCQDAYGMTKYLGEIKNSQHLTLRTSIIGHELDSAVSLVDWFLSVTEKKVQGYKNAIFSGFTTYELSNVLAKFIIPNKDLKGLYQISVDPISKYDLLNIINDIYKKNIEITPDNKVKINRALVSTEIRDIINYQPPTWNKLINDMYQDFIKSPSYKNKRKNYEKFLKI